MALTLRLAPPLLVSSDVLNRKINLFGLGGFSGWRRSIKLRAGYWIGDFAIEGKMKDLAPLYYDYLGADITEQADGVTTWNGLLFAGSYFGTDSRKPR